MRIRTGARWSWGRTPSFTDIRSWPVAQGNFFTSVGHGFRREGGRVGQNGCAESVREPARNVVGSEIRIRNVPLRVIGILAPKGQSSHRPGPGRSRHPAVFHRRAQSPRHQISRHRRHHHRGDSTRKDEIPAVVDDIKDLLRTRHHLHASEEDDFTIRTMEDIAKTIATTSRTMMLMLMSIASISLIVGGIGIMNILLVSVTERTERNRLADGRRREAPPYSASVLDRSDHHDGDRRSAWRCGRNRRLPRLLTIMVGWPTIISWQAMVTAFFFSVAVGLFFGLYPANKASKMNPIDALHYE